MGFPDHFSPVAAAYALARPTYPDTLFRFIADRAPARRVAWDCATGNGQAARDLARYFDRVIATDASEAQVANAAPHARVEYHVALAERSGLADDSVDVVTVAQALHWLDFDAFYREVRRVVVPGGLIAAWGYGSASIGRDADSILSEFEHEVMAPYWPPERQYVIDAYRTVPFPFAQLEAPELELQANYSLEQFLAYVGSWSATKKFIQTTGTDPVPSLRERLTPAWERGTQVREVRWPLFTRIGRVG